MEDIDKNPFTNDGGNRSSSIKKRSYSRSGRGNETTQQFRNVFTTKVDPVSGERVQITSPPDTGKTPSDTTTNTNIRALHQYIKETPKKKTTRKKGMMKLFIAGFFFTAFVALVFIVAVWYIHTAMRKKLLAKKIKQRAEYVQQKYDQMVEEMRKHDDKEPQIPLEVSQESPTVVEEVIAKEDPLSEKIKIYVQLYDVFLSDKEEDTKVVKGKMHSFKIRRNTLVKKLKLAIKKVANIPIKKQTLLFKNGILEGEFEDYTIHDLEITDGSILDLEVERKMKKVKIEQTDDVAEPEEEQVNEPQQSLEEPSEDLSTTKDETLSSLKEDSETVEIPPVVDFQNRKMDEVEDALTEIEEKTDETSKEQDVKLDQANDPDTGDIEPEPLEPDIDGESQSKIQVSVDLERFETDSLVDID